MAGKAALGSSVAGRLGIGSRAAWNLLDSLLTREYNILYNLEEVFPMKQHRFWAWGAVICMAMVMITGYKHK